MKMDPAKLDEFLESRRSRIAEFVGPEQVDAVMAAILEVVLKRIEEVSDEDSLGNLVDAAARDLALRDLTDRLKLDPPDRAAFDELLRWDGGRVVAAIRKTARATLKGRGGEQAIGEVTQSTIATAWQELSKWDSERAFVPWLRGIATNTARGWKPGPAREVALDPGSSGDTPAREPSPEAKELEKERVANLPKIPPEVYAEMLSLLGECDPWKALAFLFVTYLKWKPASVAAEFGESELKTIFTRLIEEIRREYPQIRAPRLLLAGVRDRVRQAESIPLRAFYTGNAALAKQISEWARNAHDCVFESGVIQGARKFLCLICELKAGAHERVSYLWIRIQLRPRGFLFSAAAKLVDEILTIFERTYPQRDSLDSAQILSCTRKIRKDVIEGKTLNDFAGAFFYPALDRWLEHIDSLLRPELTPRRLLAFAYIQGHLRPGARP